MILTQSVKEQFFIALILLKAELQFIFQKISHADNWWELTKGIFLKKDKIVQLGSLNK